MRKIKKIIWLTGAWIVKILFAKNTLKAPFLKKIYYNINGGFTGTQVVLYNLNKNNKRNYLSEFDWYKSRFINDKYSYILNNKLICNDIIKNYISIPEVLLIKEKNKFYSYDNKNYDIEEILEIIKNNKSIYYKPITAGKGTNVFRIDYKNNKYYIDHKQANEKTIIELLTKNKNYFLSKTVKQASYLNNIYDKTANTIRLITIRDEDTNKVIIPNAIQRIGIKESIPVDNGSRGALSCNINLETGMLGTAKSIKKNIEFKIHPDSKKQIEGIIIPNWPEIKKQMINLMNNLPYLKFVAWDILITDNGICVIEANSSSGVNILQINEGQKNKELGNFYKKIGIIK